MDFYNFEKYDDFFSFKKLANDYQPLFSVYKDNYETSLNEFLKEYEENTELRFIDSQLYFCNEEINIQKSIINSLEKLDHETFYYVRNRVNERHFIYSKIQKDSLDNSFKAVSENSNENDFKELEPPTIEYFINDDEDVLDIPETAKNFIKFISNRITSLSLINEFLEARKKHFEDLPESNIATPKIEKPYPSKIFRNHESFEKFKMYMKNHIVDFYTDISYLKKRMELEGFIMRVKDKDFPIFLLEHHYITPFTYEKHFIHGKLIALNKCGAAHRVNNFNNIFLK